MTYAIMQGMWLGFCIAAPVGPIGILVMKHALRSGCAAGLASGLGAALADLIYGMLAVAGVQFVAGYSRAVAVGGGAVLLWLAWKSWKATPATDAHEATHESKTSGTLTTFLLTLSNPMTILSFAAMVAGTGTTAPVHFVTGVFLGSMLWWLLLSLTAAWFRGVVEVRGAVLNRLAAVTLSSFGLWAICTKGLGLLSVAQ